jgi:hypothetical protein
VQAVLDIFRGKRPDITPAQIVAGIPVIGELLHSFGVYTLSAAQQASLSKAVTWGLALVGGDAVLRAARAHSDAKVNAAALSSGAQPPQVPAAAGDGGSGAGDTEVGDVAEDELPTDAEEFAAGTDAPGREVPDAPGDES